MHTMASTNHEQKFSSRCTELLNSAAVSTALALANKTGLLEAMLNDETPRSSHEWGTRCLIHFKTSHDILQMLHSGEVGVQMSWGEDGVRRYFVPKDRVDDVREMGALFENMLLHRPDANDAVSMLKLRSQNMMMLLEQPVSQGAAA